MQEHESSHLISKYRMHTYIFMLSLYVCLHVLVHNHRHFVHLHWINSCYHCGGKYSYKCVILGTLFLISASICDVVLNSDTIKNGSVSSPLYPSPYQPRTYCKYDFQGRGKERVQIIFSDFNLYHPSDNSKE